MISELRMDIQTRIEVPEMDIQTRIEVPEMDIQTRIEVPEMAAYHFSMTQKLLVGFTV